MSNYRRSSGPPARSFQPATGPTPGTAEVASRDSVGVADGKQTPRSGGGPRRPRNRPAADSSVQNAEVSESQPVSGDGIVEQLTEVVEHTAQVYDLDALRSPTVTESDVRTEYAVGVEVTRTQSGPGQPPTTSTSVEATAKVKHTWQTRRPSGQERIKHPAGPTRPATVAPAGGYPEGPRHELQEKQSGKQETPVQELKRRLMAEPPRYEYSTRKTIIPVICAIVLVAVSVLLPILADFEKQVDMTIVLVAGITALVLIVLARRAPLEEAFNARRDWILRDHARKYNLTSDHTTGDYDQLRQEHHGQA